MWASEISVVGSSMQQTPTVVTFVPCIPMPMNSAAAAAAHAQALPPVSQAQMLQAHMLMSVPSMQNGSAAPVPALPPVPQVQMM
jgi:hypothetical protein